MTKKNRTLVVTLGCLAALLLVPAAAAEQDNGGYLYGTIETSSGNAYTGILRWGTEEAFWDDHFNATKGELPFVVGHGKKDRRREKIKIFGVTIGYSDHDYTTSRMVIARFGDIEQIVPRRGERIEVRMKDGIVHDFDGGSNDIGATISVLDDSLGLVKPVWKNIDSITFKPTPKGADPGAYRLYGKLKTDDDTFEGFIQWDVQECTSMDKLDGESGDGEVSIAMGKIKSIEKNNSKGSWVVLKDGRRMLLEGTNDVDDSLRGIFVEDERYGRVKVSWKAFERVEFQEVGHSGKGYSDYKAPRRLSGKVVDYEGASHSGKLVFDLDETAEWEMLNGDRHDVEYNIPFSLVRSVEPQRGDESLVKLRSGVELVLEDGQDVSENNDGVVVLRDDGRETYFSWDKIKRVEFD